MTNCTFGRHCEQIFPINLTFDSCLSLCLISKATEAASFRHSPNSQNSPLHDTHLIDLIPTDESLLTKKTRRQTRTVHRSSAEPSARRNNIILPRQYLSYLQTWPKEEKEETGNETKSERDRKKKRKIAEKGTKAWGNRGKGREKKSARITISSIIRAESREGV